jgi:BirA family transcriptional regulator, biotin operon repressor / biotin---[acetyl-CoA-carboxylase] ligase
MENPPHWLHILPTCPSTNRWMLEHRDRLNHGDVSFTTRQTAGRGQYGRSWVAPPGVLTASLLLRSLPLSQVRYLSLLTGLVTVQWLEMICLEVAPLLRLKWPNDLWLDGQKLGGILCETCWPQSAQQGDYVDVVVGMGLNRSADWSNWTEARTPISLNQRVVNVPSEIAMLTAIRSGLCDIAAALQTRSSEALLSSTWVRAWNERDLLRDRQIQIQVGEALISGRGQGIDWEGGYQIAQADGRIRSITSGQILAWTD